MDIAYRISRVRESIFTKMLFTVEDIVKKFSKVGDRPFFDIKDFPWTTRLEANYLTIRQELELLLSGSEEIPSFQQVSPEQMYLTRDDKWRTFFLYAYGKPIPENCAKCPETVKLLHGIPGMKTAMFSILSPQKEIPEHRGPYGGVLRYHLGLIIPDPKSSCAIVVGGEKAHWDEGKSLIFDDSYDHEAWNKTDHLRVVLFVDFERPVRPPFGLVNRWMIRRISHSPFIQRILKNLGQDH